MTLDPRFMLRLFLRRLHVLILIALPVAVTAAFLAMSLPPRYISEARLLVESPQVPTELAASTMRAGPSEVLQVIRQRILARENMLDLSRQFRLHADQPGMSPDRIVEDMRRRINMRIPGARDGAAVVNVSFEAERAEVSADVTNALVTQILRENVALRTTVATQTLAFFDEELERLNEELSRQSERVLTFREANRDALPDSLAFRRSRQASQQERLLQVEREMASLSERREQMISMFERTGRVEGAEDTGTPEQRQLRELRNEMSRALLIFAPENPRLRSLRAQIAVLEEVVAEQLGTEADALGEISPLDLHLSDIDSQMRFLSEQKEEIEAELARLAASIDATPSRAIELEALERDYENLQAQYNQAVTRRAQARVGERIEAQARGHRITVLEQAVAPELPNRPNRRAIAMAGVGGGVGLGVVAVMAMILLNSAVMRPSDIAARMGAAPFGAVPYFRSRREVWTRRSLIGGAVLIILVGVPAALWWIDQNYLPLDLVLSRIIQRTGLDAVLDMLRQGAG